MSRAIQSWISNGSNGWRTCMVTSTLFALPERILIVSAMVRARIEIPIDRKSISMTAEASATRSSDLPRSHCRNSTTPTDARPARNEVPSAAMTARSAEVTLSHYEGGTTRRVRSGNRRGSAIVTNRGLPGQELEEARRRVRPFRHEALFVVAVAGALGRESRR
jgi:hypothetical protein